MKASIQKRLSQAKRRIERRLAGGRVCGDKPVFTAASPRFELSEKVRGIGVGGIGVMHELARQTGLIDAINRKVHVLLIHLPYHESDHVLNLAYNALCEGTRLEDIELRRNDEVFLDALGATRIPDPTTAGDFCRRFGEGSRAPRSVSTIPIRKACCRVVCRRGSFRCDITIRFSICSDLVAW